jgi:hypothetical protein
MSRSKTWERLDVKARNAILEASLTPPKGWVRPGELLVWRWLPWLFSFGGARPGEILEATGDDFLRVKTVDDEEVRYILLEGRAVIPRPIPIHPGLVQMGLLDMARAYGKSRPFFDGASASATADGILVKYRRKLKSMELIPDDVPIVSGMRNNFARELERHGENSDLIPFLLGRSVPPSEFDDGSGRLRAGSRALAKVPLPVFT